MVNSHALRFVPALEAIDVGERAQERVLDEVVGAVDLPGQRDRKSAQARHRREQRIPEVRALESFLDRVGPLLEAVEELDEPVGHGLLDELVIHRAKMVADAVLDDAVETGLAGELQRTRTFPESISRPFSPCCWSS